MKKNFRKVALMASCIALALASCQKEECQTLENKTNTEQFDCWPTNGVSLSKAGLIIEDGEIWICNNMRLVRTMNETEWELE